MHGHMNVKFEKNKCIQNSVEKSNVYRDGRVDMGFDTSDTDDHNQSENRATYRPGNCIVSADGC